MGPLIEERLEFEFLFDDQYVIVAGAQSRWARRRKIKLAELVNEPWVLPRRLLVRPHRLHWKLFAPVGWNIPAKLWSPNPRR